MLEPVSPRVDAFIRLRKKYNTIAKKIIQEKEGFETLAENKNNASQSMETSKITKRFGGSPVENEPLLVADCLKTSKLLR
jgi:hypothetical protein